MSIHYKILLAVTGAIAVVALISAFVFLSLKVLTLGFLNLVIAGLTGTTAIIGWVYRDVIDQESDN